jgi:phosphohistidine phosphatase SixA
MKRVVILRHGEDRHQHLTESGRAGISSRAASLKETLAGMTVVVLSSPADWAMESGKIIAETCNAPLDRSDLLGEDANPHFLTREFDEMLAGRSEDAVVLITHAVWVEDWTEYLAERIASRGVTEMSASSRHGQGWLLDLEQRTVTKLE